MWRLLGAGDDPGGEVTSGHLDETSERLTVNEAVSVLVDIVEALVEVESRGVVHRDIKPENILLLDGHWHLADFGIARYAEATTAPDTLKHAMTLGYAAPEQWRGHRVTSATDVYALGVVAYELLKGKRPFLGPDFRRQHLEESPEPIAGIPDGLRSLVSGCLFKRPEARPRPQNLLPRLKASLSPNPPKDTDGRREESGRGGEGATGEIAWVPFGVGRSADGLHRRTGAPMTVCGSCDARDGERIRSRELSRTGLARVCGDLRLSGGWVADGAVRPGVEWLAAGPRRG